MPIFEYECPTCKKVYEFLCKYGELDNCIVCDDCLEKLKRIISSGGFNLKGEGFYKGGWS